MPNEEEYEMSRNFADVSQTITVLTEIYWDGIRSFRYKVVSIQVVSIQTEVVSIQMKSRFDTHVKSIRYKLKSIRYSVYLPKL